MAAESITKIDDPMFKPTRHSKILEVQNKDKMKTSEKLISMPTHT